MILGSLLEIALKAYGASAALSVAVSDAETTRGKARDALNAISTLTEKYDQAKYVVEHREEIAATIDYVNERAPDESEVRASLDDASTTLGEIESTFKQVDQAKEAALDLSAKDAFGHVRAAWKSKPDLDSIDRLSATAKQVSPLLDGARTLTAGYYESLVAAADNFARDERTSTVMVMATAFVLAFIVATAVGFGVRRGRPGIVAFTLQKLGARVFRRWYVRNLPYALSPPLYAAAQERIHQDIVDNPMESLSPEAFHELERYFAARSAERVTISRAER